MLNIVHLHGNLTADPELRTVGANNTPLARFTVAVKRNTTDKDGNYPSDFHSCQVWGKRAETIAKYFAKGSSIIVSGELQNNNYERDGVKHYSYVINVNNFDFVSSSKNSPAARGEEVTYATPASQAAQNPTSFDNLGEFEEVVGDGDLPF